MANPAINRVQGECGCGGARFLHQRSEIPRRYQYYDVYVCENCGRLEFFLAKDPVHTQK